MIGRAFEQAPAAHREQRVADKADARIIENVGDMPQRVAADIEHARARGAQHHHIALIDHAVGRGADARDFRWA